MFTLRTLASSLALVLVASAAFAQAQLTIENRSQRDMTVKIMRMLDEGDGLHSTVTVAPFGARVVGFTTSGLYYLKTKAELPGRDPLFRRGDPFRVVNDRNGYSVMTITYTIQESVVPVATGGKAITQQEFERDTPRR